MKKTSRCQRVSDSFIEMIYRMHENINSNGGQGKVSIVKITDIIAEVFDENSIHVEVVRTDNKKKEYEIKVTMNNKKPQFGL